MEISHDPILETLHCFGFNIPGNHLYLACEALQGRILDGDPIAWDRYPMAAVHFLAMVRLVSGALGPLDAPHAHA